MISYDPFWLWYNDNGETTYTLIKKHKISASLIQRMRDGKPITTKSIDKLCKALDKDVSSIIEYIPDDAAKKKK